MSVDRCFLTEPAGDAVGERRWQFVRRNCGTTAVEFIVAAVFDDDDGCSCRVLGKTDVATIRRFLFAEFPSKSGSSIQGKHERSLRNSRLNLA